MLCCMKKKTIHHADRNPILYPPILFHGFMSTAVDTIYKKYTYERGPEFFIW